MASLQQLNDDIGSYLQRRDYQTPFAGWVQAVETELSETLRSKFQIASGVQALDNAYITLPPNFATMESIRDSTTGVILDLKDSWSGSWTAPQQDDRHTASWYNPTPPRSSAYRILALCIEFLPHPVPPDPPDPNWQPQQVLMNWYVKPVPLVLPSDTNAILENFYEAYLYGILVRAGVWARESPDDIGVWDAKFQQAVTRANLWSQQSTYSGSPYREEMACSF